MKRTFARLLISFAVILMLNALPGSYGYVQRYVQEETYQLVADGYISGRAKITCWQHGRDEQKVDIRVDIVKAFKAKGHNLLSAYIIDFAKNGPESYLEIGKPVFSRAKYDYVGFSQQFTAKHFPPADKGKACPLDSIGRIVVVVGTSPPSDSDTLRSGAVDIIAATTAGTAKQGSL